VIWDNESISQYIVNQDDRLKRLHKRFEAEENREYELPFVTVPEDYGQHRECYYGGNNDERGNY